MSDTEATAATATQEATPEKTVNEEKIVKEEKVADVKQENGDGKEVKPEEPKNEVSAAKGPEDATTFYEFSAKDIDGNEVSPPVGITCGVMLLILMNILGVYGKVQRSPDNCRERGLQLWLHKVKLQTTQ